MKQVSRKLKSLVSLSAIFVTLMFNVRVIAGSNPEKMSQFHPPTVDPTYGLPLSAHMHPLAPIAKHAKWIWAAETSDSQTVYVRKTFDLKMQPRSALLYVTANNRFEAWINGRLVGATSGSKGDLIWTDVQHFRVAGYLRKGRNVIAISGKNLDGAAGILAIVRVNGSVILNTGGSWKVTDRAPASTSWHGRNFDDSNWKNATVVARYGSGVWESSDDYLAHMPIPPNKVTVVSGERQVSGARTLVGSKGGRAVISPDRGVKDTLHVLVFDFGKELAGRVQVYGTRGRHVIITTGESLQECTHKELRLDNHGPFHLTLAGDYPASTPYTAFRYARLQYDGSEPLTLTRVRCDFKYYPVQYKGSFDCSDPLLTRIWYTGAYTAHLCMQEDIWDAPKRDRGLWIGDMQVTGQTINVAFGDRFLLERSIGRVRELAQGGRPDSALPVSNVNSIPGYSAAWFCTLAEYYLHQGDKAFLMRQHVKIVSLLKYLQTEFNKQELFDNPYKAWDFCDWSPGFIIHGPLARATTDLYIILGVHKAIYLLNQLGDKANAERYEKWERKLVHAARTNLYDVQMGSFGNRLQENVMAILSGVATPQQASAIYRHTVRPGSPAWTVPHGKSLADSEVMSPYYGYFVLCTMGELNDEQDALDLLHDYWGDMLARGTTTWWEMFDPSWPHNFKWVIDRLPYLSLSHGWSSGPTSFLTERILGVRPTAPGYAEAIVQPNLCELKWVEGNVPTPHGIIHVKAYRSGKRVIVRVKLPAGIRARIVVPGASRIVDRAGEYTVASK